MTTTLLIPRPRHPLFRQTFLRGHVVAELTTTEEVLAVKFLVEDLERGLRRSLSADERSVLLDDFFGREEPERQLYLPLTLSPHVTDKPILPPDYLTSLSDYLARPPLGAAGVLLAARSGAGKTVAGIKAFRDCLVWPRDRDQPLLAGRLPVRLAVSGKATETPSLSEFRTLADTNPDEARNRAQQINSPVLVEELLWKAANLNANPPAVGEFDKPLRQWLNCSPSLLLFIDLNAVDNDIIRLAVARSLRCFQETYAFLGHRCVVTYRSTEAQDDAVSGLRERDQFHTFDLAPIDAANAVKYLQHLRVFETDAYQHFGLTPPRRNVTRECHALEEFVQRYTVNRESLVSTPLIMELVALLRPGDVEEIRSLTNLYERVTMALLERQGLTSEEDQDRAITAMVRLALSIVARGPNPTSLAGRRGILDLLAHPEYGARGDLRWHPTGAFWLGSPENRCPYYSGSVRPAERYRERALFATRNESVGFLHDSFVYYFAAYSLRFHDGRERPPADAGIDPVAWPRETAARILPHLASWEQPLEFVGGMLSIKELRAFTVAVLTAEPQPELTRALARLLRGRRSRERDGDDVVLRQMERAVRSLLTEADRYPEALFTHVYNHLAWCEEPQAKCHAFADSVLKPMMNATGRPWLRAETPMPPLVEQVLRCDSNPLCVATYALGQFITGHEDGTVRRWWSELGHFQILYSHEKAVRAVAVDSRDGVVFSGGDDCNVLCWQPERGCELLYQQASPVYALTVTNHDRAVVSGGEDGAVRRWLPFRKQEKILYEHGAAVTTLVVDSRIGIVVSGGLDSNVCCWHQEIADRDGLLYRHSREVYSVAVDSRDGAVISGGWDGTVRRWQRGQVGAQELYRESFHGGVNAVTFCSRDGSVISGGDACAIHRWEPGHQDPRILYAHESGITGLAVDDEDTAVISIGSDNTVRRLRFEQDGCEMIYRQEYQAWELVVDGRNGAVIFGGSDGGVRHWLPGQDRPQLLYKHEDGIDTIAVDSCRGAIITVDLEGMVKRWQPGLEDAIDCSGLDSLLERTDRGQPTIVENEDGPGRRTYSIQTDDQIIHRHNKKIRALSLDTARGILLLGDEDAKLRMKCLAKGFCLTMLLPYSALRIARSLDYSRFALVLGDGRLVIVRVEPSVEALLQWQTNPEGVGICT